ncbi:FAD/NAD(P)-binding domain-containing protein [Periconia macrospinosa]|uniref:FAD/NAD(P)-binding domain-containing protein n=1 Tax=Periconia macrospinosa TaxID=97972 RepID=A0A2V1DDP1_9PLEO|nr:FAD/NAD(P)-binding domain-containing protein [Periconia macrospinosa]
MAPKSILIVGCGIAGSTLASFLQLSNIPGSEKPKIIILERASKGKAHLRGQNIDIRGVGVTIIRKLGLEDRIRASTTGEQGALMVDERNHVWAQNEVEKEGRFQSPTSDIEILRGRLAELCWKNSQRISAEAEENGATPIDYIFGDYLDMIDQDGQKVRVRFAKSGEEREFDLVVGADGMQSLTRKMVWGEEGDKHRLKSLHMYAGFFSIPREEVDDKWRRWFHAPGRRGIMLRPDDQGLRSTVFMYVVNDKDSRFTQVATKENGGIEAQKALLEEYYKDAGWKCDRIIRGMQATDDFYYDAVSQVKMDSWTKGRVVLLGDAGYCASPLSGMGTSLAFAASYKLAGLLQGWIKSDEHADVTAALEKYNEQMRPIVKDAQKLAPGQVNMMAPETLWGIWFLRLFAWSLSHASIIFILFGKLFNLGPQAADYIPVDDFGFKDMSPWKI